MKEYDGKVRVVFKNMVVHPQVVMDAHKAGCAAGKQQKFIAYKDAFWEKAFLPYASARDPSKLGKDNIMAIAKDLGLDTAKLEADMNGEDCNKQIQDDMQELSKFHVNATPSFFINGHHIDGAIDKAAFSSAIDEQLKVVQGSGVSCEQYYEKKVMGEGEKTFKARGKG